MPEQVKLMNMCMIVDADGRVLVQDRKKKDWDGLAFPGGKVEPGESLTRSVIREIYEETGLTIVHPKICGVKEWHHPTSGRNIVLFYRADQFSGELRVFLEDDVAEMWYEYYQDGSWETMLL